MLTRPHGKRRALVWICLAMHAAVHVAEEDSAEEALLAKEMPPEWFAAPRTASELGITRFSQSPMLDGRRLPPVEERLPDDPVVIQPYRTIGKYGGTARITLWDAWQFFGGEHALTLSADMRNVLPNLAASWSLSEDGRVTTIRLRSGIRWSDGAPLTADDFMFRMNHVWLDREMNPVTRRLVRGSKFVKLDELTFQYVFPEPNPMFANFFAHYGMQFADPMHFFRHYHPAYRDRDELEALAKEKGFITWMAMYRTLMGWGNEEASKVPTLRAYRVVERTPTKMRFERNPYYFKIDPAGNQLPYIDAVDAIILLENSQMIAFQAATGQLDFAAYTLKTQDIPLLKLGEAKGVNKVHIWRRVHVSDVAIQPNYNYPDPKYRALLWGRGERRFVRALSHAIDRDQLNEVIYFGRGVPSQVTAHPSSRWYEQRFAEAHIRYDPDYARALLDELGLRDVDGDGLREYADESKLTITLEYLDFETPKGITMELVSNYWREVGIDVRLKSVERSLQAERAQANRMQMTLWHADKVIDILFPLVPDWFYPHRSGWDIAMWNHWARYYQTDGELGEAPPELIRTLQNWGDELRTATTEARRTQAAKALLAAAAENLWTIGTVGQAPHPVVVSTRLRNVTPTGIWGWDNRWTLAYHPATWYIDEKNR